MDRIVAQNFYPAARTTTGASAALDGKGDAKTFQAAGTTSAGAGAATIAIQGSNDGTNYDTFATITLTLATTTSSDSFVSDARYAFIRANVTAISGTNAAVTVTMAY